MSTESGPKSSEILEHYAVGRAVRLQRKGQGHYRTEIEVPEEGLVVIGRHDEWRQELTGNFGYMLVLRGDYIRLFVEIRKTPENIYTFHKGLEQIGSCNGEHFDLAIAHGLGLKDPKLEKKAKGSVVDGRLIGNIKKEMRS